MNDRGSKIYLCNGIKLDRGYKNVLNYTEQQMVTLCQNEAIASRSNYSFIKHGENSIRVDFTYSDCLRANYIAFQNTDYNSKWFFAFIDSVEYESVKTTIIHYTIDVWSTWFNKITVERCFVEREHVNDDTLGKHLVPEGLDTGDYKTTMHFEESHNTSLCVILGTSSDYLDNNIIKVTNYNGILSPITYYRWDLDDASMISFQGVLNGFRTSQSINQIVTMFMAPTWLAPYSGSTVKVAESDEPATIDFGIPRITSLDGYVPKNNKALCYPYCCVAVSNSIGQFQVYKQEVWELNNDLMKLRMFGALTTGCSIRAVPLNYNGYDYALDNSVILGKFSQIPWANDLYTNWLTQNGINLLGINAVEKGLLVGGALTIGGIATGNMLALGSGIGTIVSTMEENERRKQAPAGIEGSLNSADVLNASRHNCYQWYHITVTEEFGRKIDNFFNLFGYKVNEVKIPNITGRAYWNFIKIGGNEILGYGNVPHDAWEKINEIARAGTTIWHNHTYFGNYALNNAIV